MRRDARPLADDRRGFCTRNMRQRQQWNEELRWRVQPQRTRGRSPRRHPLRTDRALDFSIRQERHDAGRGHAPHARRRGPAIAIIEHRPAAGKGDDSIPIHTAREQRLIEACGTDDQQERGDAPGREQYSPRRKELAAPRHLDDEQRPHHEIDGGADHEQPLHPDQRHQDQTGDAGADNRPQGVDGVDLTDRPLSRRALDQRPRDQRKRHPGADRRGQHDGETDRVPPHGIGQIPFVGVGEGGDERRHPSERRQVHRERGDGQRTHGELHASEQSHRVGGGIGATSDPPRAKGQSENERREHQLERMRRAAQHERQHPDPPDLVDEAGQRGGEAHADQQPPAAIGNPRRQDNRRLIERKGEFRLPTRRPDRDDHDEGDEQIDRCRGGERAGQTPRLHQPETGDENADRRAGAVGEVEHRERAAGLGGNSTNDARAHQGERHAQQHRLRENQRPRDRPFDGGLNQPMAERRKDGVVDQRRRPDEQAVENESDRSRRELDDRVPDERSGDGQRPPADQVRSDRHPSEEDHEHDDLGVRAMPDKEAEVAGPDRLVDQSRGP